MPYKRSPAVLVLKKAMSSLEAILPGSVYKPFYAFAFGVYRTALRGAYSRRILASWLRGDRAGYRKARTVRRVMPYSLVGASGLEATYAAALDAIENGAAGCFVECGVAQGGCSALMAMVAGEHGNGRKMWLFDSFEGLPSPTENDFDAPGERTGMHVRPLVRGSCLGTQQEVEGLLFSKFMLDRNKVVLVKGWFQETLPQYRNKVGPVALLRLDGDWYESTKCCLENLYDQVVSRGWIIIDDYETCYGSKRAVDEFLAAKGLKVEMRSDGRGGVLFEKPA